MTSPNENAAETATIANLNAETASPVCGAAAPYAHPRIEPGKVRPHRNPLRLLGIAVVLLLASMVAHFLVTQKNFRWDIVGHYLFNPQILSGVVVTIYLTAASMAIGVIIGVVVAVMRLSRSPILSRGAQLFTWVFRGIPTLVQLLFWYNIASLLPSIGLGIPYGPEFISTSPNQIMTPLIAALLGLGVCEGAYMSEIIRAGLQSVDHGQREAASALGLTARQQFRKIILPQAMRTIIPPTGNEVIGMLKYTSLASVISTVELLEASQQIYQLNFLVMPLLTVASLWYLAMTTLLSVGQFYLERYFGRGVAGPSSRTARDRRTPFGWRAALGIVRRPTT
jgi:polar amino acid transport system permease protein